MALLINGVKVAGRGKDGAGVAAGGVKGQVLTKRNGVDYDTEWTDMPTKTSELTNDSGFITGYTETDPTVPAWAKAETKPSYTADEVGADASGSANAALESAKSYTDEKIAAIPAPDVSGQIETHNTDTEAHADIRESVSDAVLYKNLKSNLPYGYWVDVVYGDGVFVAVTSTNGKIARSVDGINWTEVEQSISTTWAAVSYGNGVFVAIYANGSSTSAFAYSVDGGVTWHAASSLDSRISGVVWKSVAYGNGLFVAVGAGKYSGSTAIVYSADGINWTYSASSIPTAAKWTKILYDGGIFVAISSSSAIAAYSSDGVSWSTVTLSYTFSRICYGAGKFVLLGNGSRIAYSENGSEWTVVDGALPSSISGEFGVAYGNGVFSVIVSPSNVCFYSNDGITWTSGILSDDIYGRGVQYNVAAFGDGLFVAIPYQNNPSVFSVDGITWMKTLIGLFDMSSTDVTDEVRETLGIPTSAADLNAPTVEEMNAAIPTSAEDVGALPIEGGTLTGKNLYFNNGGARVLGDANRLQLETNNAAGDTSNRRILHLRNSTHSESGIEDALALYDVANGVQTIYKLYGEHNPPPGATDVSGQIETHNTDTEAHADIRAAIATPDWNQNDPTQPDYVKNRTHWAEVTSTVLFPEVEFTGKYSEFAEHESEIVSLISKKYIITYDGVEYECTSWVSPAGDGFIGDGRLCEYSGGVHEEDVPFCIYSWLDDGGGLGFDDPVYRWEIYTNDAADGVSHTVEVAVLSDEVEYHPLDENYIPDTIARTSYALPLAGGMMEGDIDMDGNVIRHCSLYGSVWSDYLNQFIAASTDGVAYTIDVDGFTPGIGSLIVFIPNKTSASTAPTLNINGTGASTIKRRLSGMSSTTASGYANNWLYANKPQLMVYDGTYWIVLNQDKPQFGDLYGVQSETWTFTLEDGSTVTKTVVLG